jgi:hypothetical protein
MSSARCGGVEALADILRLASQPPNAADIALWVRECGRCCLPRQRMPFKSTNTLFYMHVDDMSWPGRY